MAEPPRPPVPADDSQDVIPLVEDVEQEALRPRYSLPPADLTDETSVLGEPPPLAQVEQETDEPRRPRGAPAAPLPRMWKVAPEEPDDDTRRGTTRDSAGGKPPKGARRTIAEEQPGTSKLEETPVLDTYEGRKTARLIIGSVFGGLLLLVGLVLYNRFAATPRASHDVPRDEALLGKGPPPKAALDKQAELEALGLFDRAREFAQKGRTDTALTMLTKVTTSYPGTRAAKEAREALDRPGQNLPLFLDRPAVAAEPAQEPKPEPRQAPPQIVVVQPKQAAGNARLTLPANPAELTPSQPSPLAMANSPDASVKAPVKPRPLPLGFTAKTEAGVHSTGWPLAIVGDRDGATMVFVPGGTFTMGNDNGAAQEAPAHQVQLSSYYIDQHEVTAGQFRLFLKETHYRGHPSRSWSEEFRKDPSDAIPMVMVSHRDAQAYAEWAQKKLPTEAQWEMAARSTDGRLFPWGPDPITYSRPRASRQIEPVKSFPEDVSPYGVFDMAGNAAEWTSDWYDQKAYKQIGGQVVTNPTGPATKPRSLQVVIKGGAKNGSASYREGMASEKRLSHVGFRCALPVSDNAASLTVGVPAAPPQAAPGAPPAVAPTPGQPQAPAQPF
jgi:sulfatase modifying factor 1